MLRFFPQNHTASAPTRPFFLPNTLSTTCATIPSHCPHCYSIDTAFLHPFSIADCSARRQLAMYLLAFLLISAHAFSPPHIPAQHNRVLATGLATGPPAPPSLQLRPLSTLSSPRFTTALRYTNDPVGDIIAEINPAALAATFVAIAAIGFSFVQLLPSIGAAAFELTEAEEVRALLPSLSPSSYLFPR